MSKWLFTCDSSTLALLLEEILVFLVNQFLHLIIREASHCGWPIVVHILWGLTSSGGCKVDFSYCVGFHHSCHNGCGIVDSYIIWKVVVVVEIVDCQFSCQGKQCEVIGIPGSQPITRKSLPPVENVVYHRQMDKISWVIKGILSTYGASYKTADVGVDEDLEESLKLDKLWARLSKKVAFNNGARWVGLLIVFTFNTASATARCLAKHTNSEWSSSYTAIRWTRWVTEPISIAPYGRDVGCGRESSPIPVRDGYTAVNFSQQVFIFKEQETVKHKELTGCRVCILCWSWVGFLVTGNNSFITCLVCGLRRNGQNGINVSLLLSFCKTSIVFTNASASDQPAILTDTFTTTLISKRAILCATCNRATEAT